jgi:hypothetical protein
MFLKFKGNVTLTRHGGASARDEAPAPPSTGAKFFLIEHIDKNKLWSG